MIETDIKLLRSEKITDTQENGGRENKASEIISGVKFNLFPRVTSAERETGVVRLRKLFMANMNTSGETAYGAFLGLSHPGNGGDSFFIARGTADDTQETADQLVWTGCGRLNTDATAGDSSIQVYYKSSGYAVNPGDLLIIKDSEKSCNVRVSAVSFNGNTAYISLENQLPDNYSSADTYAGVMLELGNLAPSLAVSEVNSLSGAFDSSMISLYNAGTELDTFSITFTSGISFSVTGVLTGSLPSGTITGTYAPLNSKTGRPFFSIPASAFSGTFEAGNSISFSTTPASASVWIKESVPAGCPHEPDNKTSIDWLID